MKKAFKWCDENGLEFHFHDYRKDGLDVELLKSWVSEFGLETVINKRGTTWRKLPENMKAETDEKLCLKVLLDNPAIIKRPIFEFGELRHIGFSKKDQNVLETKLIK
jgi:arsenate reductase (glutaredoxin)